MQFKLSVQFLALLPLVQLVSAGYEQCGGVNWGGKTTCDAGWHCEKLNDYYSQCLPGGPSNVEPTPTPTTLVTVIPTGGSSATSTGEIPSATGEGPGSTLRTGYYWIRAVAAPNYRKYLQSSPPRTTGDAIIDNRLTAGQFNVVSGQLVQLIDTTGTLLYAHVARKTADENRLKVTWSTEKDTYGTFGFSGDTLTWSTPGITRQNPAAWLVCENQRLYANLGAYGYMTPAGCADQTIHYYNGAQADP